MSAVAKINGYALALGHSTSSSLTVAMLTVDGDHVDRASLDATATANGRSLATTALDASVGGDGVLMTGGTSGFAMGEGASADSMVHSFAIITNGADIAFGFYRSTASGGDYQDAYAMVDPYGDITSSHSMAIDGAFAAAISVGIAIDLF